MKLGAAGAYSNFNYRSFTFLPGGEVEEYMWTFAALPRHSFRTDGALPKLMTKGPNGRNFITSLIEVKGLWGMLPKVDPFISYRVEDFIRLKTSDVLDGERYRLECNLETELSQFVGKEYNPLQIRKALEMILKADVEIHYPVLDETGNVFMRETCLGFADNIQICLQESAGDLQTTINANMSPTYIGMLRCSGLNKFERRMIDDFPPISRRWYEVMRLWRSFRSKTRNNVSINYCELCNWMPMDRKLTEREMREQINSIHKPFIECEFVKSFEAVPRKLQKETDWVLKYVL